MKIAFYAPLKSPSHPVPSGDRLMARMLIDALGRAGHEVSIASELRSFMADGSETQFALTMAAAAGETERLRTQWLTGAPPDAWFCYHPYYKAPDLIGPGLAAEFSIPYVTAEASYSLRRNEGIRAAAQRHVLAAIEQAAVNICLTQRDRDGLVEAAPACRHAMLAPFIDTTRFPSVSPGAVDECRLVTVAMMRSGDKMHSYQMLARSLSMVADRPWTMTIVGDGPCRPDVRDAFAALPADRLAWLGEKDASEIPGILGESALYLWPGCGEAYGLAYLEAQAAGLAVIAQRTAGVPEVVRDGVTGLLTPEGDINSYAAAIRHMIDQPEIRRQYGENARRFVHEERSSGAAARRLDEIFGRFLEKTS
jgi:glycosyltransferase involved in cell wall biosynthesis